MDANYDEFENVREMDCISRMTERAIEQGLLTEVLWSALQNNTDNILDKCYHALNEWDC